MHMHMFILLFSKATVVMAYLLRIYITGKIGGITGDVMGAGSELSEIWLLWLILILGKFAGMTAGLPF